MGRVRTWNEVTDRSGELVTFCRTIIFEKDGARLESSSTLRFRPRSSIEESLANAGFVLDEMRDASDRPGHELVFLAHRPMD